MSLPRAEFRYDFDLSSVDVKIESNAFRGCGTITLYNDNVLRLREFVSTLRSYPLQPSAAELSEPGNIVLAVSQHDCVGHLVFSVQVSEGPCMTRIAIRVDYPGLELFSRQLTKLLDGELEAFDLVQSAT